MDLGLDLVESKSADEYALLRTRGLAAATALADGVIGFDDFLNRPLPLVFEKGDRLVGAGVHAVGATVAAFVHHLRDIRSEFEAVLDEDGSSPRRRCLCLQDGFIDAFRRMGQPTQKDAVRHEIYRAQFHMGLKEESLAVERNLEELRDLPVVFMGMNARGQNHQVSGDHHRHPQGLVVNGDHEFFTIL